MSVHNKPKITLRFFYGKTFLLFVSLIFVAFLLSFYFISVFNDVPLDNDVGNEAKLKDAINNAVGPIVISLDGDLKLTDSLVIPSYKDITITSNNNTKFFKLIGVNNTSTIIVEGHGMLRLDGIIVTHIGGDVGSGVVVNYGGTFTMSSGMIVNNIASSGGGVYNNGSFTMSGYAMVANNTATMYGGGVFVGSNGVFELFDETIVVNNTAGAGGGGVFVDSSGTFKVFDSVISNNTATGGGVCNADTFELSVGGVISNNTARNGGGVYITYDGFFNMVGGVIVNNVVSGYGGGVYNSGFQAAGDMSGRTYYSYDYVHISRGIFNMSSGIIANNTAYHGGGVYNRGNFSMPGGEISNNIATSGGGVFMVSGDFWLTNGYYEGAGIFEMSGNSVIANNTAALYGGGVCNYYGAFNRYGGKISGNISNSQCNDVYNA